MKTVQKIDAHEEAMENVLDVIRKGHVNYVINTMSQKKEVTMDGFLIRLSLIHI